MKKMKIFIYNTFILLVTSLTFRIIDIFFTSYISKKIGSEMLGIYQLTMSVYLFGITLSTSGINLAVTRIISEELAINGSKNIPQIMKKCLYIAIITSSFASFIFYINCDFIVSKCLNNSINKEIIYLICLALPLITMSSAISGYFAGVRRIYKNAIGQFIEHVGKVIVTAFLISKYLPKGLTYSCFALILGDLISEIISFVYIYLIFLHDKRKNYSCSTSNVTSQSSQNNNYLKSYFHISIPIAVTSYIRSGLSTLKQLIIPSSLTKSGIKISESLSKYGIITGMAFPIILFPDILVKSFSTLLIPEFARYKAKGDQARTIYMTKILMLILLICSLMLFAFFYFFSDKLAVLLYQDITVGKYIRLLSPLTFFIYLDTIVDAILRGLDAQVGVMLINILDLVISTSFIYFVVPLIGVPGYIISIYISEILNFCVSFYELWKVIFGCFWGHFGKTT